MRFRSSDVATATGGRLVGPDVELDGASFDSRSVRPGQLFVPLVAARDGHEFVRSALAAGAGAYLTSRPALDEGVAIEVDDTAQALMRLAAWARGHLSERVVGVTGSVGKTSTKDLVTAALQRSLRVTANERSFNNEQGLPVTILGASVDTDVLVLEMGMRGFGQIAQLCEIGRPTIGVVTAVGHAHTELVGGIEGVAVAKRELVEALPASGTAVLNADDHRVVAMASHTEATVVTYGEDPSADVRITHLELDELARAVFVVETPWGRDEVRLAVSGLHMASNAAAAIAVAGVTGVSLADAVEGLAAGMVSGGRMQTSVTAGGAVVVDDTYNANPTSMRAALETVARISARRRFAVLGEMAELDDPVAGHREMADLARSLGFGLVAAGTARYGVEPADDPVAALEQLAGGPLGEGDVVLFKGSRVAAMERQVQRLLAAR